MISGEATHCLVSALDGKQMQFAIGVLTKRICYYALLLVNRYFLTNDYYSPISTALCIHSSCDSGPRLQARLTRGLQIFCIVQCAVILAINLTIKPALFFLVLVRPSTVLYCMVLVAYLSHNEFE